jgi:hypothetical protein
MEAPRSRWSRVVRLATALASPLERTEDESRLAERALDRLGQHMLEGQDRRLCGVEQEFGIPAILRPRRPDGLTAGQPSVAGRVGASPTWSPRATGGCWSAYSGA